MFWYDVGMAGFPPHDLQETFLEADGAQFHTSFLQSWRQRADGLTAVIMHGAGQADSLRHAGLAKVFADSGISVISLDFVGHGKTGGKVSDNSLALRLAHTRAAIQHWTQPTTPLILCGFSMSGHVVLRLLPVMGERVRSIGLFCPATYAAKAEDVFFGPAFTNIIRAPSSWQTSLGLRDAKSFAGRAIVIVGSHDTVIPWEVIATMTGALKHKSQEVRLEVLGGVTHKLAAWLSAHQTFSEHVVAYLAEGAL